MTELEYFLVTGEHTNPAKKHTAFDYATKLVVPVVAITATTVEGFKGAPASIQWSLIGVTVGSFALGFSTSIKSAVTAGVDQIRDQRAARKYSPLLRKLARQFGDFVNGSRQDTLHHIADSYLCEGHGQKQARLGMPNMAAWSGRSDIFSKRLDRQKPTLDDLQLNVLDFHDLVGTYINQCALTVFDRLPQDLMTSMTPRAKSNLAAFQLRFERFQSESEQLLKEIAESRPSLERLPHCFASVKPLP